MIDRKLELKKIYGLIERFSLRFNIYKCNKDFIGQAKAQSAQRNVFYVLSSQQQVKRKVTLRSLRLERSGR